MNTTTYTKTEKIDIQGIRANYTDQTEYRFICTECDRDLSIDLHYGGKGNCCTSCYIEIYEMQNEIAELVKELKAEGEKLCYYCEARSKRISRKVICRHGNK